MSLHRLLAPLFLVAACSAPSEEPLELEPVSLEGWKTERIALPPSFAPSLPAGDELLLFAPGMFDPVAEDFWSYAFVMRVEQGDLDAAALSELFEVYYDGLMLAVGEGKGIGSDPAQVDLRPAGDGRFEATVQLIEAFVTLEPMTLRVLIETEAEGPGRTHLRVQASPQPAGHGIWRSVAYAARTLEL